MDQGLGITVTCDEETGALYPNIFEDLNGDERVLYCDGALRLTHQVEPLV